ncbi:lipoprotein [Streptomyces sp. NRRL S-4]|nr:lipoprotein [Streptomyces sp. NRRL S-4]
MRGIEVVGPVLALMAVVAGCSASTDMDGQRLTEQRERYCTQVGTWQKAQDAARTDAENATGYDEVGALAQDAFLAMRPLRDETVGGGRTLGEATAAAMNRSDSEALGRVVKYCDDAGFETLTR